MKNVLIHIEMTVIYINKSYVYKTNTNVDLYIDLYIQIK